MRNKPLKSIKQIMPESIYTKSGFLSDPKIDQFDLSAIRRINESRQTGKEMKICLKEF